MPRKAFHVDQTMATTGGYIPALIVEGQPGYTPMSGNGPLASPWVWGPTLAQARQQAADANARLGLTDDDVRQIRISSFGDEPDREYLLTYLDRLITSGALVLVPHGPIWLIAVTQHRDDEPWPCGRWIFDRLIEEQRFAGLLCLHLAADTNMRSLRLEPEALSAIATDLFGPDVHDRVRDLLDVIDTYWQRLHPAATAP